MAFDLEEQEQIDSMKAFWNHTGKWIAVVVAGLALGYVGYKAWTLHEQSLAREAAVAYSALEKKAIAGDLAGLRKDVTAIETDYVKTSYASRAALLVARVANDKGDTAFARTQLSWVVEHSTEPGLKSVALLRLAAIELDQKNYPAALTALGREHDAAFDAEFLDLKGDVQFAKGDTAAARDSYKSAVAKLSGDSPSRPFIQTKLEALGG